MPGEPSVEELLLLRGGGSAEFDGVAVNGDLNTATAPRDPFTDLVDRFLTAGWAGATAVTGRTLRRAYARDLTPAERAYWSSGEAGRRAADVYLTRPWTPRNQWRELDHKQLPILLLPVQGRAVCPWLTSVLDDGTRALLGWAITLTPTTATVLTALRMALVCDPARSPFGAIPAGTRVDRGPGCRATRNDRTRCWTG